MSVNLLPATPRQVEILDRAMDLAAEGGLSGLTLKRVAERVGFTEAAIYRHFASKEELVLAMLGRLGQRLLEPMSAIAADRSRPPRERLLAMVRHHVGILRGTRGLPIVLIAEGLASGDQARIDTLGGFLGRYRELLASVLEELDLPVGVEARQQTLLFFGLPAAFGLVLRAFPALDPTDTEVDALVEFYVTELTAPARALEERP